MFKVSRPARAPANHAPVAANDTAVQVYTGGTVPVDVVANDTDTPSSPPFPPPSPISPLTGQPLPAANR